MAKSKSELERECRQLAKVTADARRLHAEGEMLAAVSMAVSGWPYIDGMLQYERRFGDRHATRIIDSIELVLVLAPLTFDIESLEGLGELLRTHRRIASSSASDLNQRLVDARALLWDAYDIWDQLEREGEVSWNTLLAARACATDAVERLLRDWDEMGLASWIVRDNVKFVRLANSFDTRVNGTCPECGAVFQCPKSHCLKRRLCKRCDRRSLLVITSPAT